ncbi:MAG TPA: Mth938-like domain-containing protein [Stenotrophomonas sp.]|nr:Mth938-like domain-containing protein [Stenotrophomonas sp.]
MQLSEDRPDYAFALRAADGRHAKVNDRVLTRSFLIAPDQLVEDWPVAALADLRPEDLAPVLALSPALVLLGTGSQQGFPEPAVLAACLTRGVGLEAMSNDAAARTYNVLAAEGRKVVLAMILEPAA